MTNGVGELFSLLARAKNEALHEFESTKRTVVFLAAAVFRIDETAKEQIVELFC